MTGPIEPSADMRTFAKTVREMYIALVNEGFEERQALIVVGQVVAAYAGKESQ